MSRLHPPKPPRFWELLADLLVRGEDARFIREDLAESYARDVDGGLSRRDAGGRYARNLVGSVWSITTRALIRFFARGAGLDAKLGIRMLKKQPMLTGVAMLALGLGIPASLSMHHGLRAFYRPLPVPNGERIMGVRNWNREARDPAASTVHDLANWREALTSFESLGAVRSSLLNVHSEDAGAAPVRGAHITASSFELLGATPLLGRVYGPADEVRGAPRVVILGEGLWASRFGRDPDIVGKAVDVGRDPHTVVGIMPQSFQFPLKDEVWLPLRASPVDFVWGEGPELFVYGRLGEGVTTDQAVVEVELLTQRLAQDSPQTYGQLVGQVVAMPLLFLGEDDYVRTHPEVLLIQALMLAMLFIVCGNVGVLILARTATRTGEISIRTALGASRGRIITQIFIEALVLAVIATGLGLLLSHLVVTWLTGIFDRFGTLPYWIDFSLDGTSISIALGLAVVSAGAASLIPALKATRQSVQSNLQRTAAGNSTIRFGVGSTILIVSEVVLSVGFLAMGGTTVRSLFQDTQGQLGFTPEHYLTAQLRVPEVNADLSSRPEAGARVGETQSEVLRRLAADPNVAAVGMGRDMPGNPSGGHRIVLEGEPGADTDISHRTGRSQVDVAFLGGLGRPILSGRHFTAADVDDALDGHRSSVIVNSTFVEQVLEGRSPIGQRFRLAEFGELDEEKQFEWFEIVGVVGRFGTNVLNPAKDANVYYPVRPEEVNPIRYLVEVGDDPSSFVPHFREIVASVDPEATLWEPIPLPEYFKAMASLYRGMFLMQVMLAGVAFLLSITGLYALMSFTVAQRTREIGIRTALGARPWAIVSTIARRAAAQLSLGLVLGSAWAWQLLREIADDPKTLPINIPMTIGATIAIAALVGMVACASPTLRGLRIQPTEALREF